MSQQNTINKPAHPKFPLYIFNENSLPNTRFSEIIDRAITLETPIACNLETNSALHGQVKISFDFNHKDYVIAVYRKIVMANPYRDLTNDSMLISYSDPNVITRWPTNRYNAKKLQELAKNYKHLLADGGIIDWFLGKR